MQIRVNSHGYAIGAAKGQRKDRRFDLAGQVAGDLRASVCRLGGGAARRAGEGRNRPPRAGLAAAEGEARRLAVGAGLAAFAMGRKGDAIQEDLSIRFCVAFSVDCHRGDLVWWNGEAP